MPHKLPFVIAEMFPHCANPDIGRAFLENCKSEALSLPSAPEDILKLEAEVVTLKAKLSASRDQIEAIEAALPTLSDEEKALAYSHLFNTAAARTEQEDELWRLEAILFALR